MPKSSSPCCRTRPTSKRCCSARMASPLGLKAISRLRKLVIDMSSISPMATEPFARTDRRARRRLPRRSGLRRRGRRQGGVAHDHGAAATPRSSSPSAPLFEKMGKNITLVGGVGDGQPARSPTRSSSRSTSPRSPRRCCWPAGPAPTGEVRQALLGGFAASRVLEVHGERMIKRTFNPGFRIRLHRKDLGLAREGARDLGVELPQTATRRS